MANADRPSYVALFDILGFAHLVRSRKPTALADDIDFIRRIADEQDQVRSLVFSDTVLLYTEGTDPPALHSLLDQSCRVVAKCNETGIMLRGGIARGQFLVRGGVFLGEAMVRAYELEKSQEWMGAIIDPWLADDLRKSTDPNIKKEWAKILDDHLLVSYPAPIKGGSAGSQFCLGWPRHGNHGRSPPIGTRDWSVIRKFANTDDFARAWSHKRL